MPVGAAKLHGRRHPAVRCSLKTKSAPHGHLVKGAYIPKSELESVFHKRALRNSVPAENSDLTLSNGPPEKRTYPAVSTPGNTNSENKPKVPSNLKISDDAKENRKAPPKLKPKPNYKTKSQDELWLTPNGDDSNKSVKDLRDQLSKLLIKTPSQEALNVNPSHRKSRTEQLLEVANVSQGNVSPRPASGLLVDSGGGFPKRDRGNERPASLTKDDDAPSPRIKTSDLTALFGNKATASPTMDQLKTVASPSPRRISTGQKPVIPDKPKPQTKSVKSDSLQPNELPKSEAPKKSSARPAVPKKSFDSAKLAELRKSLSNSDCSLATPKPSVPAKPPVHLRPKVEKEKVEKEKMEKEKVEKDKVEKDTVKEQLEELLSKPPRSVSPMPDKKRLSSQSDPEYNGASSISSTVSEPFNFMRNLPAGSRLSSASDGLTEAYRGSNASAESTNFSETSSVLIDNRPGSRLSNSSGGSTNIPAEFMQDTTIFSGASRFVATPWKVNINVLDCDQQKEDTRDSANAKDDHIYGDIWSCTTLEPLSPERRNVYEDVDLEFHEHDTNGHNDAGYKKVFKRIRKLVKSLTHLDDSEWKDCDSDNTGSPISSRPIRMRVPSNHAKTRSLQRGTLKGGTFRGGTLKGGTLKAGTLARTLPKRAVSYEDVYLPGEDSDSDSWMTESDSDNSDGYYEEIDSGEEDDLDDAKEGQSQGQTEGQGQIVPSDPVAPPRRKSLSVSLVNTSAGGLNGSRSESDLSGSRSNLESKAGLKPLTPHGSPSMPMAAVMGQLQQALKNVPNRDGNQTDRGSALNSKSSSHSNLRSNPNSPDLRNIRKDSSHNNLHSNTNSPDLRIINKDSSHSSLHSNPNSPDLRIISKDANIAKDMRLNLPYMRTSLSSSPSSVSASSVSSTSSTSSSSSLPTPVPIRPAPKPPSRLSAQSSRTQSDVEDAVSSSGYSSESDLKSVAMKQSRDSPAVTSPIVTSSNQKEDKNTPKLPPTLPPRKKRLPKPSTEPAKLDEPPTLPPPRVRWLKPVNPQNVSTSKEAMFPRSRSPEKIYQGQTGQGEGQTIPDSNANVQNPEDFVKSFITVNEDRHEGFENDFTTEVDDMPQSKETRSSSIDSAEGGNYLELLDEEVPAESDGCSPFVNEPLYQIYHCGVVARNVWESSNDFSEDDGDSSLDKTTLGEGEMQSVCGTLERMAKGQNASENELHATLQTLARGSHNFRTLWYEMPEVQKLGVLESMTPKEKKFQESLFEIITSEASYLKSLSIFLAFFVDRPGIKGPSAVISEADRKELFSNITNIKEVSKRFMNDMETRWKQDPMLSTDLCEIVCDYAHGEFSAYVTYCANLVFQERKLRKLRESNERFQQLVLEFEARPECKSLPIDTFLTLPMQRITRMPLLVDAVCQRTEPETPEYITARKALVQLQKLVRTSNERARQIANIEQNTEIDRSLDFKKMKKMPIVSQSKSLVKKGKLTRIFKENKGFLGNKRKESLYLFLFNDLLIIAKKKNTNPSNETRAFQVVDYANRNAVEATVINETNFTKWLPNGAPSGCQNLFVLALVDNHEHRHAEFYFACESLSERMRWVETVTAVSQTEDEKIYEDWDCPQVQVIHRYVARQPDELTLEESDVINVYRKVADGWYEGERIRDGEKGWFPANYTVEIQSAHVRARNLKQRYRLLTVTEHFLLDSVITSNSSKA